MTDGAPGSLPTATDEAGRWLAVRRLRREHPRWVVIWLASAGCYRAYPLFRAPQGTALTAPTPDELAAQMNQFRPAASRRPPAKRTSMSSPAPAVPGRLRDVPGWPGSVGDRPAQPG